MVQFLVVDTDNMIIIFVFIVAGNTRGRQGKYDRNGYLLRSWPGSSTNDWFFMMFFVVIFIDFFFWTMFPDLFKSFIDIFFIYIDYFGLKCIFVLSLSVIECKSIIMK